jgi:integrase
MQSSVFYDERRKCWRGYITLLNGKRRYISASTGAEAKIKVRKLLEEYETGNYARPSRLTVAETIKGWLNGRKAVLSPTTVAGYQRYINKHIIPWMGNMRLLEVSTAKVNGLYANMANQKLKYATIKQVHSILHKFFKDMMKQDLARKNPCDNAELPTITKRKYQANVPTTQEYKKMLKKAEGTRHFLPVLLAGGLGLRRGEVFALRWKDIDFKKNTIHICQSSYGYREVEYKRPKSESGDRTISVPSYIMQTLREHKKKQKVMSADGIVITMDDGSPVKPYAYSHAFAVFLKANNLKHIRFHDLRHFNATVMLQKKVPIKAASKRLGHSTTQITMDIYQDVLESMDKDAAHRINSIMPKVQ